MKIREEKVSLLLFPGYSEFHTDRSPDEATHSNGGFGFSNFQNVHFTNNFVSQFYCHFCHNSFPVFVCLFSPILWHNSCPVQFIRGPDVKSAQAWLRLPPTFAKLSPAATNAGCTNHQNTKYVPNIKHQIITSCKYCRLHQISDHHREKSEAFADGKKVQLGQIS